MDNYQTKTIYEELQVDDAQEMAIKADIVADCLRTINARGVSIHHAAVMIGITEPELYSILSGHFHLIATSALRSYLATLSQN